jgi:ABC-2 type transport system permease protein
VTILKSVFLKGSGLDELAVPITLLILYAGAVLFLAARAFRQRLD